MQHISEILVEYFNNRTRQLELELSELINLGGSFTDAEKSRCNQIIGEIRGYKSMLQELERHIIKWRA